MVDQKEHKLTIGFISTWPVYHDGEGDERTSQATVLLTAGLTGNENGLRFETRSFPSNAIKFTHTGQVRLDVTVTEHKAVISVSDTGIGILPAEHSSVFSEFYRSQNAIESAIG